MPEPPPHPLYEEASDAALGRPALAHVLPWLYLAGLGFALVSMLTAPGRPASPPGLILTAALAAGCALVLLAAGRRLPVAAVPGLLACGTLLISAAIHFDGRTAPHAELVYAWVAIAMSIGLGLLVYSVKDEVDRLISRLRDAARRDSLTGMLNRLGFNDALELELERARRSGNSFSVIVLDLDGFKAFNETCGHGGGDNALRAVAAGLAKWKRRIDPAARIGGQEFGLVAPDTGTRGAYVFAERLRRAVAGVFAAEPVPVTASLGIATFPAHGGTPEALLQAADRALLAAKEFGRNRSVVYSAEIAAATVAEEARRESGDEMQLATLLSLAEALDIRDTGTARHSRTVGRLAELMAEELGLTEADVSRVRLAGVLHDIGKIGISDRVLNKPGPLTDEEWAEMRTHPEIGARLLARPEFEDLRAWILAHHERPDGRGYPLGLSAAEIPLEAAIIAVADAFEAMTADRIYRRAMALEAAVAELEAGAGSQFEAQVVEAFGRVVAQPAWSFSLEGSTDSPLASEAAKGS